jgi:hypothetical protein
MTFHPFVLRRQSSARANSFDTYTHGGAFLRVNRQAAQIPLVQSQIEHMAFAEQNFLDNGI